MDDTARALLAPYVTNVDRPVFALRNLPEEVVAVLFAYYSRSRDDLRTNLLRLIRSQDLDLAGAPATRLGDPADEALALAREKARQFHEKWVVGYGHASVAEHAVAHVAVEDVSILVSKAIEDHRLASYTEKSTRYVVFERGRFYRPDEDELPDPALRALYLAAVDDLFSAYESLVPVLIERIEARADRSAYRTEAGFRAACRAQACDLLRYLLPAATHTNLGITANARTLERMISKLRSHPLAEARAVGAAIQREAQQIIPTLIRYADRNPYLEETHRALADLAAELLPAAAEPRESAAPCVRLVRYPEDAEAHLAAAILYRFAHLPWEALRERVAALPRDRIERIVREALDRRGPHDPPLRCLEHLTYTYEIFVDYGAYRDIQRHRMCTQTDQLLTTHHGYLLPPGLADYGLADSVAAALDRAAAGYERLARFDPYLAQYVVPLAYRKRLLVTWNLREIHHFVALRSSRQGHPSYRRVALEVWEELNRVHPLLAAFVRRDSADYELTRPA